MAFESVEKEGRIEAGVLSRCHTMTEDRRCVCGGGDIALKNSEEKTHNLCGLSECVGSRAEFN